MTTKQASDTLSTLVRQHGFPVVLSCVLLGAAGYWARELVADNRRMTDAVIESSNASTKALAESTAVTRELADRTDGLEDALERQVIVFERLLNRLDRE